MTKTGAQYICTDGERIVGAFVLNDDPAGSYSKGLWKQDLAEGSYLVVHALAVDPNVQKNGIGSEILRFCTRKAKEEGFLALRADVVPTNTPASRLFEKNGFSYAGDANLNRGIEGIPVFSLYELNFLTS